MSKSKLFFIFLLILTGLIIPFSSAGDLNQTDSFNDFQNLVDESGTDEINITSDYCYHEGDNPITINKSLVINGNNHTFNALNKSSIFNIEADNVSIVNLNFLNANAGESEIWLAMTDIVFHDVVIDDNGAFNDYYYNGDVPCGSFGGAVYSRGNNLVISDSTFQNSYASIGGAVYIRGDNSTIKNTTFINNLAYNGGAVYYSYAINSTISNSRFIRNSASFLGAGIYQKQGRIKISNSTFINNSAVCNSTLSLSDGYWEFSDINSTYYNSFIDFNSVRNVKVDVEMISAGTYELRIYFPVNYDNMIFPIYDAGYSDVINKSFSLAVGGEIYNLTVGSDNSAVLQFTTNLTEVNAVFFNPITHSNYTVSLSFLNNSFYNLKKLISQNDEIILDRDYVFCSGDSEILINKSVVIDGNGHIVDARNMSRIFNIQADNVVIKNITLTNGLFSQETYDLGDIIFMDYPTPLCGYRGLNVVTYDSGMFKDISYPYFYSTIFNGGAVYSTGKNLRILNSTFTNCHASRGGAVFIGGNDSQIIGSVFLNNNANEGGAVFNMAQNTSILNSYFDSNNADYSGNSIYSKGDIVIANSSFFNTSSESVAFHGGNWKMDDMNSTYFNSYIILNSLIFKVNASNIHDDYYNLKISFGYNEFWVISAAPEIYDSYGYAKNKRVCFEINGEMYNATSDSNSEVNLSLKLFAGINHIKVINPITNLSISKEFFLNESIKADSDVNVSEDNKSDDPIKKITAAKVKIIAQKNTVAKKSLKVKITVRNPIKNKVLKVKFKSKTYRIKLGKNAVGYFKLSKKVLKKLKKSKKYSYKITYGKCNLIRYFKVK